MEQVPVDLAAWATGDGLRWVAVAAELLDAGADDLALATRLRHDLPPDRAAFVAAAAHARRRAVAAGIAGADRLVLTREGAEQASHPAVAAWRAARAAAVGAPLQDWCAGTGGDAVALAAHRPVVAVEGDPGRAVLARHRAAVLGRPVDVVVGDVLARPVDPTGAVVHADPDRRDARGRRARTLAGHRPAVPALLAAAAGATATLVAVAPGVSWEDTDLPGGVEVVFVQVGDRLVEACLVGGAATDGRARAVLLPSGRELVRRGPVAAVDVGEVGTWLLRPAPALVRARLHDRVAADLGARRVARRRALLTCDGDAVPTSPWCRTERVVDVVPPRPAAVRAAITALGERAVELVLHGVDVDPARFLRAAGRPTTGPDDVRVHLVRRDDDAVAVVTTHVD